MFMFKNMWKTVVLASLMVGFFCFTGGISAVLAVVEGNSFSLGTGPADLAITGSVKIGNQTSEWGGTITLTPADSFLLAEQNNSAAFNIHYSETNNGGAEALSYRNEITFSGNMVSQQTNRSLLSLASTEVWTQAYFPLGDGSYEFVLMLDADDQMREGNEDDNFGRLTIKFSGFGEEEDEMLPAYDETREPVREAVQTREQTQAGREDNEMLPATNDVNVSPVRAEVQVREQATSQVRMSCGNSSGGDGLYSLCKGDTVFHNLGVNLYNRAYDGGELKLKATGLTDTYIRLKLNTPMTVYDTDRVHILQLKYTGKDDAHGAFLQISQEGKVDTADDSGMLPATNDSPSVDVTESVRTCEVIKTGGKRVMAFGDNKVYYAYRGYKYWFPNEEIYLSWFGSFDGITVVSQIEIVGYTTGDAVCKNTANVRVSEGNNTSADSGMLPAFDETIRRTPNTNASEATGMSCGNSEGGDGLYSACKGDTIYHRSGVKILNRAYDEGIVKFMLSGATQTYARTSLGKSIEVTSADGKYNLRLTYIEKSAKYGAFVQVATSFNDTDETADSSNILEDEVDTDGSAGEPKNTSEEPEVVEVSGGVDIDFKVFVNNYPEHQNYALSENLSNAYVNMYFVELQNDGMFKVTEADIKGVQIPADNNDPTDNGDPRAVFSVAPGKMVYFEGFKSYDNALQGVNDKMEINWSAPPYKNFSANNRIKDKLCQTNFSNTDMYLSCSDNLSTPYQD